MHKFIAAWEVYIIKKITFLLILIIFYTGCQKATPTETLSPEVTVYETAKNANTAINNEYTISFEIDDFSKKSFEGYESVYFVNSSKSPIDKIKFNLPLNILENIANTNSANKEYENIFGDNKDNGHMIIQNVKINNEEVSFNIENTTLEISLKESLPPGQKVQISFNFEGIIPQTKYYFGWNNNLLWLSNIFPELAILNDRGWNTDISYLSGDPRFKNCSNYTVLMTVPEYFSVIGHNFEARSSSEDTPDKKTLTYKFMNSRDFSFAIYNNDQINTTNYDFSQALDFNFYFYSKEANEKIEDIKSVVAKTVDFCNNNIGRYPYGVMDFVEVDFYKNGGFSNSQTIFLDSGSIASMSDTTIAALVARQWFSAIIGSDQIKSPWISEGLSAIVAEIITNKNISNTLEREYIELGKFMSTYENSSMLLDLSAYKDNYEFSKIQVTRSKLMFFDLMQKMGEVKFYEFLNRLFVDYSFNIVDRNSLIDLASEIYGSDLNDFFKEWQEGFVLPKMF